MPVYHFTRVLHLAGQRRKICGLLQMYACNVAIVTSYGVKKDGLKTTSQREVTQKLRKEEQSFCS